jgi:hypothetical protein
MSSKSRLEVALVRIRRSRSFTTSFLNELTPAEWFWRPSEMTTHIAWQVGHLAVAEYNLCLRRVRGRTADDQSLISDRFIDAFKGGSKPEVDRAKNLSLDEIQQVFDRVQERSLAELTNRTEAELDVPVEQPHPAFKTKLEAVEWSPQHELVHAGQIALLRRLMGKAPLR